jgi:hypothetical protein
LTKFQKKKIQIFTNWYPTYTDIFNFYGFFKQNKNDYYSLLLAKIICQYGFDGWIIEPYKIMQRSNIYKKKSNSLGRYEEILLCIVNNDIKLIG